MADEPKLIIALEARLDRFERQLREAGLIAQREVRDLESKMAIGTAAGNLIAKGIERASQAIVEMVTTAIDELKKFNDLMEVTALSAAQLQRIGFAGLAGGIDFKTLAGGLDQLALKMDDINRGETELSKFLDANNLKYRERNGLAVDANKALELAATLMSRAGSEAEKIRIAEKFGLTRDWVKVLGEGVEKFREMQNIGKVNPELERAVRHMEALGKLANALTAEFKSWGSSLVTFVLPAMDTLATAMLAISFELAKVAQGGPIEDATAKAANSWATIVERIRAARAEAEKTTIVVNKPSGVKFPREDAGTKNELQRQEEALRRINALTRAELETVGLTVAEQEKRRQITLLEEAAKRAGLEAETAVTAQMREQARLAGELKQQLVERQFAWSEMMSASRELGSIMSDAMKSMVLEGQKFDAVLKNVLNRIASRAFDKLFDLMFAAPAGGGGSLISQIFGGKKQHGGPVRGGSAYLVGEGGPELFVPNRSGMVVPNTALAGGGRGSVITGGATAITVQGSADQSTIAAMRDMLAARDRRFVADVAHATVELRRRSVLA
jgi:DNA-binding Xre family transcriptional regulator